MLGRRLEREVFGEVVVGEDMLESRDHDDASGGGLDDDVECTEPREFRDERRSAVAGNSC